MQNRYYVMENGMEFAIFDKWDYAHAFALLFKHRESNVVIYDTVTCETLTVRYNPVLVKTLN